MPSTQRFDGAATGSMVQPAGGRRCVIKCVRKCVIQLHTSTAARPRQHWAFARHTSPTTRPPHRTAEGLVRVVGLVLFSFQMLAGAGVGGSGIRRLVRVGTRGGQGEGQR
jgi:hypothetical protein